MNFEFANKTESEQESVYGDVIREKAINKVSWNEILTMQQVIPSENFEVD